LYIAKDVLPGPSREGQNQSSADEGFGFQLEKPMSLFNDQLAWFLIWFAIGFVIGGGLGWPYRR